MARIALLNSRKPRRVSPLDRWVRVTALLARKFAAAGDTLVTGLGPLHYDLPLFCALDAGGRADVVLDVPPGGEEAAGLRERFREVFASPVVRIVASGGRRASREERDRAVAESADLAVLVEARTGGIVERIALERLRQDRAVLVCPADGRPGTRGNERVLAAGAAELPSTFDPGLAAALASDLSGSRRTVDEPFRRMAPRTGDWDFVVHFTRSCPGELPGESRWRFLETLASSRDAQFHGAERVLERILAERRIRAGGRLIRGGQRVVSFTAAEPAALGEVACWARHLGRWTFEPYGIGVRRGAAVALGLRPAIYGPPGLYAALPGAERYLFQVARTAGRDWSAECEWRALGDVDLSRWPAGQAIVVVPDAKAARRLGRVSPFPVRVLLAPRRERPAPALAAGPIGW